MSIYYQDYPWTMGDYEIWKSENFKSNYFYHIVLNRVAVFMYAITYFHSRNSNTC